VRATGDFVHTTVPHIEHPATRRDMAVARMVAGFDRLVASPSAGDADLRLPIVIVTAGEAWWGKPEIDREWRASHQAMAKAAPHRRLLVAERSKHDIPEKRPDTIVEAAVSLIERDDAVQEQGATPQVR
jgi:hypothetical protein